MMNKNTAPIFGKSLAAELHVGSSNVGSTIVSHLLAASQIHQVQFPTQFLLSLHMLLFDVDQEDAVAARTVLVHVCTGDGSNASVGAEKEKAKRFPAVLQL